MIDYNLMQRVSPKIGKAAEFRELEFLVRSENEGSRPNYPGFLYSARNVPETQGIPYFAMVVDPSHIDYINSLRKEIGHLHQFKRTLLPCGRFLYHIINKISNIDRTEDSKKGNIALEIFEFLWEDSQILKNTIRSIRSMHNRWNKKMIVGVNSGQAFTDHSDSESNSPRECITVTKIFWNLSLN